MSPAKMWSTGAATRQLVIAAALVLLAPWPSAVEASGVFELRLKSFINENGKDSLGKCCSGSSVGPKGECSGVCRTRFYVCLKEYQVNIDTSTPCTYGNEMTPVLGENVLNLTAQDAATASTSDLSFANPIRFYFNFTWMGAFSLIVEAFHDTDDVTHVARGSGTNDRVIITRLAMQQFLDVGPEWIQANYSTRHSMMLYEFRVTCATNYYGNGCDKLCRPRDDNFGHYRCSPTGQIVCLSGWKGDYCNKPHCLPGCDEQHGQCSRPNECICHQGWTGRHCDQCIRYPGCLHGTCQKPWQCICDEGWGGLFCNQDLNFCTNHKPCHNGGTCFNTGQGSYTCSCAPGFAGTDCKEPLLDCTAEPCMNNGTCLPYVAPNATANNADPSAVAIVPLDNSGSSPGKDGQQQQQQLETIERKYRCTCPAGWRGKHCEISSKSCKDQPCARGATCEDDSERGYSCHCPAGFTGPDCDRPIDECAPNPCANGATCTDLLAGFKCHCPAGFTGERCQINVDDCQGNPCLNGGTCIDHVNSFRCQCVAGYVGWLCQDKVDYCVTKPCANGGSCLSTTNDYQCVCRPGFAGKDCSVDVDECKSSPCQHGGTCRNRVNGFSCDCTDGWRGETCAESSARPGSAGYWSAARPPSSATQTNNRPVAAGPEAQHAALTTEHVVVIATISTAVPAFVLVAALAVMCMKRRQKREQAKADEEARLQNERNAVHSSMSKRAGALLSPQLEPVQSAGDSHMIKNTWTGQPGCGQTAINQAKSVNNAMASVDGSFDGSLHEAYGKQQQQQLQQQSQQSADSQLPEISRPRPTKQLNTEAAAHRASQHLYQKDKDCLLGGLASSCHQLMDSKRSSSLFSAPASEPGCCSGSSCSDLKRPNTSISEQGPPDDQMSTQGSDTPGCGVYVIDDHYRHDTATLASTLATEV